VARGDTGEVEELLRAAYQPVGIPFRVRRLRVYSPGKLRRI